MPRLYRGTEQPRQLFICDAVAAGSCDQAKSSRTMTISESNFRHAPRKRAKAGHPVTTILWALPLSNFQAALPKPWIASLRSQRRVHINVALYSGYIIAGMDISFRWKSGITVSDVRAMTRTASHDEPAHANSRAAATVLKLDVSEDGNPTSPDLRMIDPEKSAAFRDRCKSISPGLRLSPLALP